MQEKSNTTFWIFDVYESDFVLKNGVAQNLIFVFWKEWIVF